jgi:uncharacterized protein (TIGR02147 family)
MGDLGIFGFSNYRDYLSMRLGGEGSRTGLKKRAAEAMDVHTTLVSQVLKGHCELSLEQAEKLNKFLNHTSEEASFFLLLILRDRAGTTTLKKRFETQIEEMKGKRLNLTSRVPKEREISIKDQERFYSSFLYSAIHVLSSIPRFNKVTELSRALGVADQDVQAAVDFLKRLDVVKEKDGVLTPGTRHVHLGASSQFVTNHHLNWRLKAVERIRQDPKEDLHYSGALSLSEDDVFEIKEILVNSIAKSTKVAMQSKEETAYVFCLDFFRLNHE